jgi:hypothetical protein
MCEANEINHSRKLKELIELMANKYDPIRKKYWNFVYKQFYFDKMKVRFNAVEGNVPGGNIDETWKKNAGKNLECGKFGDEFFRNTHMKLQQQKLKDTIQVKEFKPKKNKKKTPERTFKIGSNLLLELMSKYER